VGSSTVTIQAIVDAVASMGELIPVLPTGGYSTKTALTIASDVMASLISQRFNWKWNRMKVPPFYTNSWQQDYAQLSITRWPAPLGWIEGGYWIDINNTALPKPVYAIEVLRDLPVTSVSGNPPSKIDWLPNDQLTYGVWPGAAQVYTQPLGATITPTNPPTNIIGRQRQHPDSHHVRHHRIRGAIAAGELGRGHDRKRWNVRLDGCGSQQPGLPPATAPAPAGHRVPGQRDCAAPGAGAVHIHGPADFPSPR
jgi:hypothetical protein